MRSTSSHPGSLFDRFGVTGELDKFGATSLSEISRIICDHCHGSPEEISVSEPRSLFNFAAPLKVRIANQAADEGWNFPSLANQKLSLPIQAQGTSARERGLVDAYNLIKLAENYCEWLNADPDEKPPLWPFAEN